jgi:hypothetical protein
LEPEAKTYDAVLNQGLREGDWHAEYDKLYLRLARKENGRNPVAGRIWLRERKTSG